MKEHISNLSGGNQQKVIVARWLANDPDVLIMDEPTRGIDVGAKHEIYEIMCDLAKQGKAIIMISSEMSELLGMSDRICVMCNGKLTGHITDGEGFVHNLRDHGIEIKGKKITVAGGGGAATAIQVQCALGRCERNLYFQYQGCIL